MISNLVQLRLGEACLVVRKIVPVYSLTIASHVRKLGIEQFVPFIIISKKQICKDISSLVEVIKEVKAPMYTY